MQPADLKPQTVGSTITYCRRYALMSVLGLVGGAEDDDGAQGTFGDSHKSKPATNGTSHHARPASAQPEGDDELWDTPAAHAKKPDTLSQAQLTRLTILVTDFYGPEAKEQQVKLSQAVSKGTSQEFKDLTQKEAQILIAGIEKKMKEVENGKVAT
jgi:hypothetical protein